MTVRRAMYHSGLSTWEGFQAAKGLLVAGLVLATIEGRFIRQISAGAILELTDEGRQAQAEAVLGEVPR